MVLDLGWAQNGAQLKYRNNAHFCSQKGFIYPLQETGSPLYQGGESIYLQSWPLLSDGGLPFAPADHSSSGGLCPLLPASIIFGGRGISTMITFPRNCEVSSVLATWPSTRSKISLMSVSLFFMARLTIASIRSCAYCFPLLSLRARKASRGCVSFFGRPPGLPLCPGLKMCALNSAESSGLDPV